jgi:hypothetical protein
MPVSRTCMWNAIRHKDHGHIRRAPTVHAGVNGGRNKENGVGVHYL